MIEMPQNFAGDQPPTANGNFKVMMRIIETLLLCGKLGSLNDFRFTHRDSFPITHYASIWFAHPYSANGRGFHQKVPHIPISCVRDALSTTSSVSMLILPHPRRYDSFRLSRQRSHI